MNLQDLFDQESKRKPNTAYAPSQENRERNRQLNRGRIGPNAGKTLSEEQKAKMSAAKLGKKRDKHTEETRAKMSEAATGRKHSAETRAKIGAAVKLRGPVSDETRAKLAEANKKRDYSKPIMTPAGVFPSVALAAQAYDISYHRFIKQLKLYPNDYYYIKKEV